MAGPCLSSNITAWTLAQFHPSHPQSSQRRPVPSPYGPHLIAGMGAKGSQVPVRLDKLGERQDRGGLRIAKPVSEPPL
jgi:hypothetical protein